ncbi:MAG TPA: hypothetical protein VHX40_06895, partial [Acidimicrobiales bacterium]|nr:hypothetical protein [Acidimicrobiales bacterium]
MDELVLVRRATSPRDEPDPEMLARVRARVVSAAAPGRSDRRPDRRPDHRPRTAWFAVAVVVAALAAGVGWVVAAGPGPSRVTVTSAGGTRLSLRLVDDQVRLVTAGSLSSMGSVTAMACFTATTCEAVGEATDGAGAV